ncbi:hypothetical protein CO058_03505 [candidate division WWE3 bacterium CG_4_9_14_0_2_um_filter_35_11]|uniref:Uncharacterized protein n=1 Tax=candidate division WWE3 bacterium CG_4_9_14_0_2_um_filter_35_11 TaxID=1975077 RepID=A0A2M8EL56_UNCKA|nr:MAG: hypothetical protein COV25_00900 [candidate division WWE3 bacterium CG10_big_fil_rev_8_21_14_0_10_35_32]PJC23473.1 MAG: hypothetical protein CO058_03505 [candidate division WWE3 bacterium CG_4_9_14_0_2_um_filter_35_11]
MSSALKICEKCDGAFTGLVCLKCGNFAEFTNKENDQPIASKEEFGFLASVINENAAFEKPEINIPKSKKFKFLFPLILGVLLFGIGSFAYWRFVYTTPDYISPFVLSAVDVRPGEVVSDVVEISDSKEKAIPLDIKHEQGSFDQYDFAQFATPDTSLIVSAFNISDVLTKYFDDLDVLKNIKTEFDISDSDIDVFFSKGFAVLFPKEDFSTWGFSIYTADKSFADSKVKILKAKKEKNKFIFHDYFAGVVEIKPAEGTEDKSMYFLLVSNSKEYLDQMKESSEGNVTNLSTDIKYSRVKDDLPNVGQVFIYRKIDSSIWDLFVGWIASKYDYVGLDKILMAIDAPGTVFFSNSSKLKITTADIM